MPPEPSPQHEVRALLTDAHAPWAHVTGTQGSGFSLHMRGYARIGNRYYYDQQLGNEVFSRCEDRDVEASASSLRQLIPKLDGGWALVAQWPDGRTLAATDRMRTIPLFWAEEGGQLVIADDGLACARAVDKRAIGELEALEFVLAGYVTGDQTLIEGVHQIQSGEIVQCGTRGGFQMKRERYYRFYPVEKTDKPEAELEHELVAVLDDIFAAFARSLNGEQIVVPLSGGLDSRLVVAMLHRHSVPNVFCYTFGNPHDAEARISKQVAEAIGYDWTCAQYESDTWREWFAKDTLWEYVEYGCKGCSRPCIMDLPAIFFLIASKRIDPTRAIVFPGHSGDMISGSHMPAEDLHDSRSWERHMLAKHYGHWPISYEDFHGPVLSPLLDKLRARAEPPPQWIADPTATAEMWNAECRQALYIINAVRCYEFAGMRFRTLWDYPLMDFFLKVPVELRFGQRLYVNAIRDHLFCGERQALADIPLAGLGAWTSRSGLKRPLNSVTIVKRKLRRHARRGVLLLQGRSPRACARDMAPDSSQLAALGITDSKSTLRAVLAFRDTFNCLPTSVRHLLEPLLDYRVGDISWWPLVSTIALGKVQCDLTAVSK